MPSYVFACKNCDIVYSDLVPYDPTGAYKAVLCPECGSKKKEQRATTCNFEFSNPIGTDRHNNSHDYRYKYKAVSDKELRENAQKKSHMGDAPYRDIDDTGVDKNFDFSKI